jgi:hypothetical protein
MTNPVATAPHCDRCGQPDAHEFDRTWLCVDCYQQGASSCAGSRCDDAETAAVPALPETFRVNPNCCYSACPRCSSLRRLRAFQSRFPEDWPTRLRGLPRIVALAQQIR